MSITLDAITLPDDLIWDSEFNWSPVEQKIDKSLTGALIVQEAASVKGREIALRGGVEYAWMTRQMLIDLKAKRDAPNTTMVLSFHGVTYNVIFNQVKGGIAAKGIYDLTDPDVAHIYSATLNLIEV